MQIGKLDYVQERSAGLTDLLYHFRNKYLIHDDVEMAVRAMKAGAIDFLTKPFRSQDLLDAVFAALERDSVRRKMQQLHSTIRQHFESLSPREKDVIARVAAGNLNKQIAAQLGLSEVTVKVHRANAMRKMHATTLAQVITMLEHVERSNMTSKLLAAPLPITMDR